MGITLPQVFSGITPAQYAILVDKASAAGLDLSGHSGTASKYGVEVAWNYAPELGELSIQCLKTPFFMSPEAVNAKVKSLVDGAVA